MDFIRKAATTLGGILLVALVIMAVAPNATRVVASALVQVTNTSANPEPKVSAEANFPYEAVLCTGRCDPNSSSSFSVPSATSAGVPVKRLVIENLNAGCGGEGTEPEVVAVTPPPSIAGSGTPGSSYFFLPTASGPGETSGQATVRIYADPSSAFTLLPASSDCLVTLTGHLETK
jgi:hypothetical protein